MTLQIAAGILGFVLSYLLMPWVVSLARDLRILDFPDHERRLHPTPVPRLGGVVIFAATLIAVLIVYLWGSPGTEFETGLWTVLPGVLIGGLVIFITGIVDDLRGVTPTLKLVAQSVAALAVISYGFRIDTLTLSGDSVVSLGVLSIPVTILWIVGMTNAFNLIDGADGLAGTIAIIALTAAIGVELFVSYQDHQTGADHLIISCALLGAVFAFLRFNIAPAKIFLGDSGSMLLGYFLSIRLVLSATGDVLGTHAIYAIIPLFALAYPLTDTGIAIARRWLRGHPFSRADGRHVHHQVLALGVSVQRTVDLIGAFFLAVAVMGILIAFAPPSVTVAFATAGAILLGASFIYGVRWLRYSEFMELGASVASVVLNARSHVRNKILAAEVAGKLHLAGSFEELNAMLAESATELGFIDVAIVPGAHIHTVARRITPLANRPFRMDFPISWENAGQVEEVILRVWCERPGARRHLGAERIASRLAPAIELWLKNTPAAAIDAIPEHHRA